MALANSDIITIMSVDCTICTGYGMYITRGTPGREHFTSASSRSALAAYFFFIASASGLYGIGPSTTTPEPGGTAYAAPNCSTGPAAASCASRSQFAVLSASQKPFRSWLAVTRTFEVRATGDCARATGDHAATAIRD